MSEDLKWMVVRPASFKPYWAMPATFGPMKKDNAEQMAAGQYGGHVMHIKDFVKAYGDRA